MRIGPVLEVTTSFQHFKCGIEIRIWSMNQDHSQTWSPMERSNMLSIQIKTTQKFLQIHKKSKCLKQASRLLQPDQRQKQNQNREYSLITTTIPIHGRRWIDIEPSEQDLASHNLSKKVISLLRHNKRYRGKTMDQLNSTDSNSRFGINFHKYNIGLMIVGKHAWHQ